MSERTMLMQLVESGESVEPDWQDALTRAGYLGRHYPRRRELLRPRRVLVLVAVALAVIYAVSAVAADNPRGGVVYWLFDRSGETYPVEQVPTLSEWVERERATPEIRTVHVIQGTVARQRFEMLVFTKGWLCFGINEGGPGEPYHGTNVPSLGVINCGPLPTGDGERHWVSIGLYIPGPIKEGGGTGPKWLFGVANPNVSRIDLKNENDGTVMSVPTFAAPSELPVRVRLWIAAPRLDQLVHTVVPRDQDGKALEHWHLEIAQ